MLHTNGTSYHPGRAKGTTAKRPSPAQIRSVQSWITAHLPGHHTAVLTDALRVLSGHPDAFSAGYSTAKSARERVAAELATRPNPESP